MDFRILSKETPNPVGTAHDVPAIEEHLSALADQWDAQKAAELKAPWWKFWVGWSVTVNLYKVTNFLLNALDELIQLIDEELNESGADKKATVLTAIDRLYDYVAREAIPIMLRPFARTIKDYIIYTLISSAIDWIVDKYRNGTWRKNLPSQGGENGTTEENGPTEEKS